MDATSLFLQRAPLDAVFLQLPTPFDNIAQETFYNYAIAPHQEKHPPPLRYLKTFLKRVMKMTEEQNLEVIDEFAELAVETSIKDYGSTDDTESEGYLIFQINYPNTSCIDELQENKQSSPIECNVNSIANHTRADVVLIRRNNYHNQVGMKLWKAGLLMGDFCINMPHLFQSRSVLELGSGTGVTGITLAAVCHPSKIYMTDFHDEVLNNLEYNARINIDQSLSEVVVSHLDWSIYSEEKVLELDSDILIAADCTYSMDLCVIVLQMISSFLRYDNPIFATPDAITRYSEWQSKVQNIDSTTPSILFRSKKICLLCFTIRSPETLQFFFETLDNLCHEIAYEDVTEWVLKSCGTSSFYYEGGTTDLRVLCIVPS
jgi:predicted nicotinamide N-methyase